MGRNAGEGTQTGQSRVVGLGAKVCRRGAAGRSGYGRRYADGAKPGRAVGRESAQTGQRRIVGLGTKVRRRGAASGSECGRMCADGAKPGRGVGHESGFGCARDAHRSPSELIGTNRNLSEGLGSLRISSDRL